MHRTQISLEEQQYHHLKQYAQKSNRSISAVIRELLDKHLPATQKPSPQNALLALKGIASGQGKTAGRNHNDVLYTHEQRAEPEA
jgi:predicted DNA-binding ribbon-helix-helix protein